MTTVTQWFGPNQKPAYIGNYEREYPLANSAERFLDRWDGSRWMLLSCFDGSVICPSITNTRRWRGLAVKPKSGIRSK